VDQNRKATPVTQFVDVGPMLQEMDTLARKAGSRRIQFFIHPGCGLHHAAM
jgi:hypothetical protein